MKARKARTARKALSGRTGRHPKKSRWRGKLVPGLFNSLVAPLLVGLALQGLKGCDRNSPRVPQPAATAAVAAKPGGGPPSDAPLCSVR